MRPAVVIFLAVLAVGSNCLLIGCTPTDPIERVVRQASANEHFPSGLFSPIRLPATASAADVVALVLGREFSAAGLRETNFNILKRREVVICSDEELHKAHPEFFNYTAVLVDTKRGRKVVLLQFQAFAGGDWWSRVYDAK